MRYFRACHSVSSLNIILMICAFFFFNPTAPSDIYTLSLHDALPIYFQLVDDFQHCLACLAFRFCASAYHFSGAENRSEEHTSELQSHSDLVCRLLLDRNKRAAIICSFNSWRATRGINKNERMVAGRQ